MTTSSDYTPPRQEPLFLLGRIVATPGALALLRHTSTNPETLLMRHITGDWGDICKEDAEENQRSLEHGFRLMSVYHLPLISAQPLGPSQGGMGGSAIPGRASSDLKTIWLITEADRSVTTFLLPREY